jgi:ferritin-like metal-binding protein YciE
MSDALASLKPKDVQIDDQLLKNTFAEHLNYIYLGKKHLISFFAEIKAIATLKALKKVIQDASDDATNQLPQMEILFSSIGESPSNANTLGIKAMTLEAYLAAIKAGKTKLEKDIFILFYLQQIEGIEVTYFKVLKNLGKAVGYSNTYLNQPYDDAIGNKILFETIYKEYIS